MMLLRKVFIFYLFSKISEIYVCCQFLFGHFKEAPLSLEVSIFLQKRMIEGTENNTKKQINIATY